MKYKLISIALFASTSISHAFLFDIAGMDTNGGNGSAADAETSFDFFTSSQPGGSTTLDLDSLSAGTFSGTSATNLGNGVSVDATASNDATLASGSVTTNVAGISISSNTGAGDLVFTFSTPTTHFGFFNAGFNDDPIASSFDITFDVGSGAQTKDIATALGGSGGEGFYGVIFSAPVTTITLSGTGRDAYNIDEIRVTPVPEPGAFALLAGLLGYGFVFLNRRRRD